MQTPWPKCPEIDPALIIYLERTFPDTTVDPDEQCPRKAFGQAAVIRHLKFKAKEQEETVYVSTQS